MTINCNVMFSHHTSEVDDLPDLVDPDSSDCSTSDDDDVPSLVDGEDSDDSPIISDSDDEVRAWQYSL